MLQQNQVVSSHWRVLEKRMAVYIWTTACSIDLAEHLQFKLDCICPTDICRRFE